MNVERFYGYSKGGARWTNEKNSLNAKMNEFQTSLVNLNEISLIPERRDILWWLPSMTNVRHQKGRNAKYTYHILLIPGNKNTVDIDQPVMCYCSKMKRSVSYFKVWINKNKHKRENFVHTNIYPIGWMLEWKIQWYGCTIFASWLLLF